MTTIETLACLSFALPSRANASCVALRQLPKVGLEPCAVLFVAGILSASALPLVPPEGSQQFGTLAGNSTAEKHMPFRTLASYHRSTVAHQANRSVKGTA